MIFDRDAEFALGGAGGHGEGVVVRITRVDRLDEVRPVGHALEFDRPLVRLDGVGNTGDVIEGHEQIDGLDDRVPDDVKQQEDAEQRCPGDCRRPGQRRDRNGEARVGDPIEDRHREQSDVVDDVERADQRGHHNRGEDEPDNQRDRQYRGSADEFAENNVLSRVGSESKTLILPDSRSPEIAFQPNTSAISGITSLVTNEAATTSSSVVTPASAALTPKKTSSKYESRPVKTTSSVKRRCSAPRTPTSGTNP